MYNRATFESIIDEAAEKINGDVDDTVVIGLINLLEATQSKLPYEDLVNFVAAFLRTLR